MAAMEAYNAGDERRIEHAKKVTARAERLMASEGGDPEIIIAAGVLHDIGIHEAERKHGSSAGHYQELEGPPVARRILEELGFAPDAISEICEIIGHHHSPGIITTVNFQVLSDADWLVNLNDEYDIRDRKKLATIIDRVFLTEAGRQTAREQYLQD